MLRVKILCSEVTDLFQLLPFCSMHCIEAFIFYMHQFTGAFYWNGSLGCFQCSTTKLGVNRVSWRFSYTYSSGWNISRKGRAICGYVFLPLWNAYIHIYKEAHTYGLRISNVSSFIFRYNTLVLLGLSILKVVFYFLNSGHPGDCNATYKYSMCLNL